MNFAKLASALREVIDDEDEPAGERERYLIRELLALFRIEGLLDELDTVVVAARKAYDLYLRYHAYICQPNRAIRPVPRMAFYTAREIKPEIPEILGVHQEVALSTQVVQPWPDPPIPSVAGWARSSKRKLRTRSHTRRARMTSTCCRHRTIPAPYIWLNHCPTSGQVPSPKASVTSSSPAQQQPSHVTRQRSACDPDSSPVWFAFGAELLDQSWALSSCRCRPIQARADTLMPPVGRRKRRPYLPAAGLPSCRRVRVLMGTHPLT